uniref:Uncharacterized protein n=1 Tax=Panagrolaimus sp. ES5 TaxID=591445 RepID=A0AC34FN71_9BILA
MKKFTATKLWKTTHFSPYKPCPIPDTPPTPEKRPLTPSTPKSEAYVPPKNPATKPAAPNQVSSSSVNPYSNPGNALYPPQPIQPNRSPISNDPTSSQSLYNWLTDRNPNNVKESEDILFRR